MVGHVLSAVCTLPMALVSMTGLAPGIACLITSSALVFSAFPAEAPILLCMTGPLGVALGVSMRTKAGVKAQILAGTLTLTAGMVLLSKVVGIDPAGGLTSHLSFLTVAGAYVTFSLFYSALWVMALRRLAPRLLRLLDMSWWLSTASLSRSMVSHQTGSLPGCRNQARRGLFRRGRT